MKRKLKIASFHVVAFIAMLISGMILTVFFRDVPFVGKWIIFIGSLFVYARTLHLLLPLNMFGKY